jgi:importin subunit beta-1
MQVLLQILATVPPKSSVPDVVFATIGAIAGALEDDFIKYMDNFAPFLYKALENQEEPGLCSMAIGLVSDISRALNERVQPYCDGFMNALLTILRVRNQFCYVKRPIANTASAVLDQRAEACNP